MRRVEVRRGDVSLSCLDGGSGDPVVLLHGLAGSGREMSATAGALLPGRHVIAVDQRGHGFSTRRPSDLSRRAHVDDVVAVIAALAGGAPVTLVGQSMGGHTAMLTAARHPRLVTRLVMVEAGVGGGNPPDEIADWFASWPVPFRDARAAADFLGSTPIAREWLQDLEERPDGLWPRFEPEVLRAAITAVAERPHWDDWQQVRAPTLLVHGQNGTMPPAETTRMLASHPTAHHVVLPDAGHDAHLDRHDAWIQALKTFLNQA